MCLFITGLWRVLFLLLRFCSLSVLLETLFPHSAYSNSTHLLRPPQILSFLQQESIIKSLKQYGILCFFSLGTTRKRGREEFESLCPTWIEKIPRDKAYGHSFQSRSTQALTYLITPYLTSTPILGDRYDHSSLPHTINRLLYPWHRVVLKINEFRRVEC